MAGVTEPGVTNVSEGVTKDILRRGSGPHVHKGDKIRVHCTGIVAEGLKKFWRSVVASRMLRCCQSCLPSNILATRPFIATFYTF